MKMATQICTTTLIASIHGMGGDLRAIWPIGFYFCILNFLQTHVCQRSQKKVCQSMQCCDTLIITVLSVTLSIFPTFLGLVCIALISAAVTDDDMPCFCMIRTKTSVSCSLTPLLPFTFRASSTFIIVSNIVDTAQNACRHHSNALINDIG